MNDDNKLRQAVKYLVDALSEISYLCGEPNDMHVSIYDLDCDEDGVVEDVKRALVAARLAEITSAAAVIQALKRGTCWCEAGIDNPNAAGKHSVACFAARTYLAAGKEGEG